MSRATSLWGRIGLSTALSVVLLLLIDPPQPAPRMPLVIAIAVGLAGGCALYVAATRCRPLLPTTRSSTAIGLGTQAFLALLATNEEIVWRRVVLGELLSAGVVAAVFFSTVGFALVHRSRRGRQLGTGAVFGVLYVSTGALGASIAAHWLYNALVGELVSRRRAVRMAAS